MARLSNEDMAGMHMACGADRFYRELFPNRYFPGHRMLANLLRRLRKHRSFNENRIGLGRPRESRDAVEEDVLQYFCDNPYASTRAATRALGIRNHVDV